MSNYNYVCLIGNLTFDPDLSYTPNGTAVTKMRIAVNEVWKDKDGKEVKDTLFIDVTVWKKQAVTVAEYLKKGSSCMVTGKLQLNKWETESGEKRSKIKVVARQVVFLGKSNQQKIDEQDEQRASAEGAPEGTPPVEEDQPEKPEPVKDEEIPF